MRTFTAALLFVLSLSSAPATSRAEALGGPGPSTRMARPQWVAEGDDSPGDTQKDTQKDGGKDGGKDGDEEDEEEYRHTSRRLSAAMSPAASFPGGPRLVA